MPNGVGRVVDLGFRALNLTHKAVLRATGGGWPWRLAGMAAVELRTTGRRSGLVRSTMLTAPLADEHRVILVASKGGDDRDPEWYRNVVAHPDVEITMAGERRAMHARTASPEEKAALWPDIVAAYRSYDSYQRWTGRDIPVVVFEPQLQWRSAR